MANELPAVFARKDKPSGRGQATLFSPVKQAALDLGISVLQPASLRDAGLIQSEPDHSRPTSSWSPLTA